ncbi:T9SS type B sorting domain-containing protein [Lacinutrix gracilariae]|uniref:T9SS type B sorting domain-containing protein n=1 Tax=Lacinutrix gracilariae TaxID=1747198 RepID=A0ABW5JWJ5_9FLAO
MKITFIIIAFISLNLCYAQTQIGQDIDGEAPENSFGFSTCLSSNGLILAVGGYRNNVNGNWSGHARVYQNINNNWEQIGQDIDGDQADSEAGYSVSLSSDGSILAIGAPGWGVPGRVKVYQNQNDNWIQMGSTLFGGESDNFGNSVSLNSSGNILAIGAPADNNSNGLNAGRVRVYGYQNGNWVQIGGDLFGEGLHDRFGSSVSLNDNGDKLSAGATQNTQPGYVKIFENQGSDWIQLGNNIVGEMPRDHCGFSVDLNSSGTIIAIGSEDANSGIGHLRVFEYQSNSWLQIGNNIDGNNDDSSVRSVSISSDGNIVATGATHSAGVNSVLSGNARVFEILNNNWTQIGLDIDGEGLLDLSGRSVSLNADGSVLAVGAPFNDGINGEDSGHVRVYNLESNLITPMFDSVVSVCEGDTLNPLPTTSNNGIIGTWSPAIDNTQTTTYTFTPDSGQSATTTTLTIEVDELVAAEFDSIPPICVGDMLSPLPTISNNGIAGTWSPVIDNTQTTTYTFTPNSDECATVTTLTIEVNEGIIPEFDPIMPICIGDMLSPLPTISNNGIAGTWSPAIDNTQTTTYTFTPNSDECATVTTLTIEVNEGIIPEFDPIMPICTGDMLSPLPTISNNGIAGTWSPALNNTQTTIYTFTPNSSECISTTQLEITVNEIDELEVILEVLSAPFSNYGIIKANASGGSGNYEYQLDDGFWVTSNVFNNLNDCDQYIISVRDVNGCSTKASATIQILIYPKFFTPNDDGVNDRWNIRCLSYQPLAKIYVYDRYGKLLNKISPSGVGWDGTYNGKALPSNDYWFVAEYLDELNIKKTFKSHFTLKR